MPLARTPPRRGNNNLNNNRAHTFSPSQAYPDGVPEPEPAPLPTRELARTPPPGAESQPEPTSRRREARRESLADDERREPERRPSAAEPDPPEEPGAELGEAGGEAEAPPKEERDEERAGVEGAREEDRPADDEADVSMDVEVRPPPRTPPPRAPSQPATTPHRTPRAPRASCHPADPLSPDDPSEATRTPRTPRDRRMSRARTPAEVVSEPPVPIRDTDEAEYGKYYETLSRALRINTIDKGLSKLTLEHMKSCYPLLAEEKPESIRDVWTNMLYQLRADSLSGAHKLLDDYRVPKRLRTLTQVVDEANAWKETSSEGRPDAWRPDLTPFTISTGTNLEVYDQSWAELREEYLTLTKECGERMKAVQEKRERLANVDNGVSDSVVELAKTNKLLEGFPSAEMLDWAERAGART